MCLNSLKYFANKRRHPLWRQISSFVLPSRSPEGIDSFRWAPIPLVQDPLPALFLPHGSLWRRWFLLSRGDICFFLMRRGDIHFFLMSRTDILAFHFQVLGVWSFFSLSRQGPDDYLGDRLLGVLWCVTGGEGVGSPLGHVA